MTVHRAGFPDELAVPPERVPAASAQRDPATPDQFIEELYRGHALPLTRMALLLVGDKPSAEDVVQEAFLGLFRGLGRLHDPGRAAAYLRVSVLNGCRSVLRARSRARLRAVVPENPVVWSAESAALAGEDRREVLRAVARLPRRQQEVLVLRYFLGLSDQEIAADLGISRGTVVSTASRALAALARKAGGDLAGKAGEQS
ncbi:MAG: sigma-70 family RNA polymerase sigma factor [Actinobacteria bacterium]|nr:sigma-70 family RNA polymerase sigma factor [Actinomycetota bacterium]